MLSTDSKALWFQERVRACVCELGFHTALLGEELRAGKTSRTGTAGDIVVLAVPAISHPNLRVSHLTHIVRHELVYVCINYNHKPDYPAC